MQATTYHPTLSVKTTRAKLLSGANRRGLFPPATPALAAGLSEPPAAPLRDPLPRPVLRAVGRRQEPLRLRALPAAHVGPAGGLPGDELARTRRKSPRGIRLSRVPAILFKEGLSCVISTLQICPSLIYALTHSGWNLEDMIKFLRPPNVPMCLRCCTRYRSGRTPTRGHPSRPYSCRRSSWSGDRAASRHSCRLSRRTCRALCGTTGSCKCNGGFLSLVMETCIYAGRSIHCVFASVKRWTRIR